MATKLLTDDWLTGVGAKPKESRPGGFWFRLVAGQPQQLDIKKIGKKYFVVNQGHPLLPDIECRTTEDFIRAVYQCGVDWSREEMGLKMCDLLGLSKWIIK